jgi:small-conductance mechanosensitive channel
MASAILLLATLAAHSGLRWVIHRKLRGNRQKAEGASAEERARLHWLGQGMRAAIKPLAVLIWIAGVYAAVFLFISDFGDPDVAQSAAGSVAFVALAAMLVTAAWLVYRVTYAVESSMLGTAPSTGGLWERVLIPFAAKTVRLTLPMLVVILGIPHIPAAPDMKLFAGKAVSLLVIGVVAMVLYQIVHAVEAFIIAQHERDPADRFRARRIRTQVTVLRKIVVVIISMFTLASMFMVFDSVRQFGTSILASAGIAGIIIGLAAQRSLATLLAGFQIALTRPIRIDDVVIVENEWGRIEDITLTFVIVCIWDQRRLILPITYFMERPFQNWTSTSSDILCTVFVHVDYTMPVDVLRDELDRILEKSPYWDGRFKSILVTDAKEHTLEVRAMASAADGDQGWFLRCEIREKIVEFVRKNYPECLPRLRAEIQDVPSAAALEARRPAC